MTQKDYVLMANALKEAVNKCENFEQTTGFANAADALALALAKDNPRFNHEKFADAIFPECD